MGKSFKFLNNYLLLGFIVLVVLIIFTKYSDAVKILATAFFFIVSNVLVGSYKRVFTCYIEFELVMFGSVVTAAAYGFKAGALVAIFGLFLCDLLHNNLSIYTPINVGAYLTAALFASVLPLESVMVGGIVIMLMINTGLCLIYTKMGDYSLPENILYLMSNVLFNIIVFWKLAPVAIGILS